MLNLAQVAEIAGLSPETIKHYHKVATKARKDGKPTARLLPPPVAKIGQQNMWDPETISDWVSSRKDPPKMGAIPKKEMAAVLAAAQAGNVDRVITIAKRNLS